MTATAPSADADHLVLSRSERPASSPDARPPAPTGDSPAGAVADESRPRLGPRHLRSVGVSIGVWLVVGAIAFGLVVYGLGALSYQREQRTLFADARAAIDRAANEAMGLPGIEEVTTAPDLGAPVAVLEIAGLDSSSVVVEGADASQTARAPGHVRGTAGLGQPGTSVIVGRHAAYGGPFASLDALHPGDQLVVTTTQGQSVYAVDDVRDRPLVDGPGPGDDVDASIGVDALLPAAPAAPAEGSAAAPGRLVLVTSPSSLPWSSSSARVVTATLQGTPFVATPQGSIDEGRDGLRARPAAIGWFAVVLLATIAMIVIAVVAHRKAPRRVAYLLTIPPVIGLLVLASETLSRVLPAWT